MREGLEQIPVRVPVELMEQIRMVWKAEVMSGKVHTTLKDVIERALTREVRSARRRAKK